MDDYLIIWMAVCTLLVLIMQAGFTCFEAGVVRRKNSTNVALKNAADIALCVILFMFIGYPLMFGDAFGFLDGWIGWGPIPLLNDEPVYILNALFQAMFAGTAMTIISGAISERTSFRGYLVIAFFMSIFIYPITGHWAWAEDGWLLKMGFYDFAGGTVVHVVGGAIALACIIHIGPRLGRFDSRAGIEPSNLSFATLGMFLLLFGWFGFNAGGAASLAEEVPLILVNTALGATAGLFLILCLVILGKIKPKPEIILCAPLGGLVAVTPGCAAISPLGAVLIGIIGSCVAIWGVKFLERLKLDDPVSAIPVHLFAGVIGTILIPFFAYDHAIPDVIDSRITWLAVQILGTLGIAGFAFGLSYALIAFTKNTITYRVLEKDEMVGLNVAEHGASTAMFDLIQQMSAQGENGEFSKPIYAEPETDAGYIAFFYNQVRDKFLNEANRSQALLEEAKHQAFHDALTGLYNRRAFNETTQRKFSELRRYGSPFAIFMIDVDHFKKINDQYGHDVGDEVLKEIANRLKTTARDNEVVARIGGEEFAVLITAGNYNDVKTPAERFREVISKTPVQTMVGGLDVTASIGVVVLDETMALNKALKVCDEALYQAKELGRNRVCYGPAKVEEKNTA